MAGKRRRRAVAAAPIESRSTEALTIGWLLAVFTTLLCEIGALSARWMGVARLPTLSGLLLFSALIIGIAAVALGVLLRRLRRTPPPPGVFVFSMVVGLLPVVVIIIDTLMRHER